MSCSSFYCWLLLHLPLLCTTLSAQYSVFKGRQSRPSTSSPLFPPLPLFPSAVLYLILSSLLSSLPPFLPSLQSVADHYFDLSYKDRIISFLPMSHIAAQLFDIHVPIYLGNAHTHDDGDTHAHTHTGLQLPHSTFCPLSSLISPISTTLSPLSFSLLFTHITSSHITSPPPLTTN